MNYADVLIAGLVILALILAVRWIIRQKKRGGCAGCAGCAACSDSGNCKAYEAFEAEAREKLQNKDLK